MGFFLYYGVDSGVMALTFGMGVLVAELIFLVFLLPRAFIVITSSFARLSEGLFRVDRGASGADMSR